MSKQDLTTYLNDHLAGSVAALELLDHLIEIKAGSQGESFFASVRADITAAQDVLRDLLKRLDEDESTVRKTTAWIIEKLSHVKLQLGGPGNPEKGLFEALEGLVLGISGQAALWRALAVLGPVPGWEGIDFADLERRAEQLCQKVELRRLDVARIALSMP
jgi:hypothetical protein